jgi:hypothetical protein
MRNPCATHGPRVRRERASCALGAHACMCNYRCKCATLSMLNASAHATCALPAHASSRVAYACTRSRYATCACLRGARTMHACAWAGNSIRKCSISLRYSRLCIVCAVPVGLAHATNAQAAARKRCATSARKRPVLHAFSGSELCATSAQPLRVGAAAHVLPGRCVSGRDQGNVRQLPQ